MLTKAGKGKEHSGITGQHLLSSIWKTMAPKDFVDNLIAENKVMVFSKSYCPFCTMAKTALESTGLKNYKVVELENRDDCSDIQDYLRSKTGSRTVCVWNIW